MHKLPTGPFEMAPLSEFVVTERNFQRVKIDLHDWLRTHSVADVPQVEVIKWAVWDTNVDPAVCLEKGNIHVKCKEPNEFDVYWDGYNLEWN